MGECPKCHAQVEGPRKLLDAELEVRGVGTFDAKFLGYICPECGEKLRDPDVNLALLQGGKEDEDDAGHNQL